MELTVPFVQGCGVVSPAGWGIEPFRKALSERKPWPSENIQPPGWPRPLRIRKVPAPAARPAFMTHARLRRVSPIAHYGVAAGLEALGQWRPRPEERFGIVMCLMCGCVNYSRRFYDETLKDPATASPLVFPETVFNAPASHLATLLEVHGLTYTVVGDQGCFLQGLAMACQWIAQGKLTSCLVVSAEEMDWLTVDGVAVFNHNCLISEGAGAVLLGANPVPEWPVRLEAVTDQHLYRPGRGREAAARAARAELGLFPGRELLCDSRQGVPREDRPEVEAWVGWKGPRLSPKALLGEAFAASAAWQCVAAIDSLFVNDLDSAVVSVVGSNQQAIAARFVRSPPRAGDFPTINPETLA